MTQLLEKALSEVNKLPAFEQDAVAAITMEELASEKTLDGVFCEIPGTARQAGRESLSYDVTPAQAGVQ